MSEGYGGEAEAYGLAGAAEQGQGQPQQNAPDVATQIAQLAQEMQVFKDWASQTTQFINGQNKPEDPYESRFKALETAHHALMQQLVNNNKAWGDYQVQLTQQQVQAQQAQYEAEVQRVGEYTSQACQDLDAKLTQDGYPGFNEYRALVQSTIINEIPWAADNPQVFLKQLEYANNPEFWAYVYQNHVVPKVSAFNATFRRTSNLRDMSQAPGEQWTNDDYIRMRQQNEVGGLEQ